MPRHGLDTRLACSVLRISTKVEADSEVGRRCLYSFLPRNTLVIVQCALEIECLSMKVFLQGLVCRLALRICSRRFICLSCDDDGAVHQMLRQVRLSPAVSEARCCLPRELELLVIIPSPPHF